MPSTPIEFGPETLVNTTIAGVQASATVAALKDGGYVVTWQSDQLGSLGGGFGDVYAQRYDASGATVGGETLVNTTTLRSQVEPSVTGLSDGGYVIVWDSNQADLPDFDVYAQRYNASGAKVGEETLVNTTTADQQLSAKTAALRDGGYVVVWQSAGQDSPTGAFRAGIYEQRFDAAGAKVGSETLVNTTTAGDQIEPSVTGLKGGGHVVTWMADDGSSFGVYEQRYDAAGGKVGVETLVNTTIEFPQRDPSVASLADGGYIVTWASSAASGGADFDIYSQRFDAAGAKVGGETLVNTTTSGQQQHPKSQD